MTVNAVAKITTARELLSQAVQELIPLNYDEANELAGALNKLDDVQWDIPVVDDYQHEAKIAQKEIIFQLVNNYIEEYGSFALYKELDEIRTIQS
jgi:hypothetical protein